MKKIQKLLVTFLAVFSLILIGSTTTASAAKKVALNKTKATITVGKTTTLKVKNTKKTVTWKTSNKKIATVSKKGVVTAKKSGTATITAKVSGKKYTCKVTVNAAKSAQEKVFDKYVKAYSKGDYMAVYKCYDPATRKEIKAMYNELSASFAEEGEEFYTFEEYLSLMSDMGSEDVKSTVTGKVLKRKKIDSKHAKLKTVFSVKVQYTSTTTITTTTTDWTYFVKVDGKWYIDGSKSF